MEFIELQYLDRNNQIQCALRRLNLIISLHHQFISKVHVTAFSQILPKLTRSYIT